jgi:hypothetical protein
LWLLVAAAEVYPQTGVVVTAVLAAALAGKII